MKKKNSLSNEEKKINDKIKSGKIRPVHVPRVVTSGDILKYELCSEIIRFKKKYELTQNALAEKIGIHKSEISKIFSYQLEEFSSDRLLSIIESLIKAGADIRLSQVFGEVERKVSSLDKTLKSNRKSEAI